MATIEEITPTVENVLTLFHRLDPKEQADLMEKLTEAKPAKSEESIEDLFGIWQSDDPEEQADYDRMTEAILGIREPMRKYYDNEQHETFRTDGKPDR